MTGKVVTLGYVRLADAAPLLMAQELGFFSHYDLQVELQRERSWASLRDKLCLGRVDAAQMPAPLPLFVTAGVGCAAVPLVTGLALGRNGNAMAIANALAEKLGLAESWRDPRQTALKLGNEVRRRARAGEPPLRLGTVHPVSVHTIQWCQLLREGGVDWRQVRLVVLPPEQMVDALAAGEIEAFNAGAPWYAVAVARGVGQLLVAGVDIWPNAPEKVLAVTEHWHRSHPDVHLRLRLALMTALEWLREPANRRQAAAALAQPEYLDLPAAVLAQGLMGVVYGRSGEEGQPFPDFHRFDGRNAAYPWPALGKRCLDELAPLAPAIVSRADELVAQVFRPHLYHEAAAILGWDLPSAAAEQQECPPPLLGGEPAILAHSLGA